MFFVGCAASLEEISASSEDTVRLMYKELAQFCATSPPPTDVCIYDEPKNQLVVIGRTLHWSIDEQCSRLLVAGELFRCPESEPIRKDITTWGLGVISTCSIELGKCFDKCVAGLVFTQSPEQEARVYETTTSEAALKMILSKFCKLKQ